MQLRHRKPKHFFQTRLAVSSRLHRQILRNGRRTRRSEPPPRERQQLPPILEFPPRLLALPTRDISDPVHLRQHLFRILLLRDPAGDADAFRVDLASLGVGELGDVAHGAAVGADAAGQGAAAGDVGFDGGVAAADGGELVTFDAGAEGVVGVGVEVFGDELEGEVVGGGDVGEDLEEDFGGDIVEGGIFGHWG